jgi:hypothetical protein
MAVRRCFKRNDLPSRMHFAQFVRDGTVLIMNQQRALSNAPVLRYPTKYISISFSYENLSL